MEDRVVIIILEVEVVEWEVKVVIHQAQVEEMVVMV